MKKHKKPVNDATIYYDSAIQIQLLLPSSLFEAFPLLGSLNDKPVMSHVVTVREGESRAYIF